MDLKEHIRSVPDFPEPGILFYDISTLLSNPEAWQVALSRLTNRISAFNPELLLGIESRGFLLAAPLAARLGIGFSMVRKKGKLPGTVISYEYQLEYGSDTIEIQADAIEKDQRIVILDDLLATGGTFSACLSLVDKVGGDAVGGATLIELNFLKGRERLGDLSFESLIAYDA